MFVFLIRGKRKTLEIYDYEYFFDVFLEVNVRLF